MRKFFIITAAVLMLSGCGKVGFWGRTEQAFGNWVQVKLPDGCVAKQIAAEEDSGVALLCEDGRVFH